MGFVEILIINIKSSTKIYFQNTDYYKENKYLVNIISF